MAYILKDILTKVTFLEQKLLSLEQKLEQQQQPAKDPELLHLIDSFTKYVKDNNEVRKVTEQMILLKVESLVDKKLKLVQEHEQPPTEHVEELPAVPQLPLPEPEEQQPQPEINTFSFPEKNKKNRGKEKKSLNLE